MENETLTEIYTYLRNMAETIVEEDTAELEKMKAELDGYAQDISSQMPPEIKATMNQEFDKCRRCGAEWLSIYKDDQFNPAVKEDILKEEVMEFFFSMNDKVVAVQKNFFLLAMVEQQLSSASPLTDQQRSAMIAKSRIVALAREQGLTPHYKAPSATNTSANAEAGRLWYFGDEINLLQSNQEGLSDEQALDYLLE